MRVWVVRHGESETNKNGLWTGWYDAPLTEKGREDAVRAGGIVSGISFDKIYASDLSRARHTAEIAIPGCSPEISSLLREINVGNIAGKPLNVIWDSSTNRYRNEGGYVQYGGESLVEFRERVAAFMRHLETQDCERVALFAHAGFLRQFLDLAVGIDLPAKKVLCKNCTIAIFEYREGNWSLHSWINPD